ncbi:inositol transport system substrate-binding protein [Butyrivibrio sp. ob235]|uniref:substrate-binding domain-containing protein n=1 Tax=Butyrivibrio sp. ob235 TaxID=1761780 RepID=UPI0008BE040F|nr:substrate-binding domain-containing protein [Butyrivibrio sp. ob235]SEL55613.1 inositol transport system substrate-binding protein [Butyrivibrio sp. ob235]
MKKNFYTKILSIAVVLVLTASTLTGCGKASSGGGSDGSGVKVFFSTLTLDDFKELVQNSVIEAGAKNGVTVDVGTPCATVDEQVQQFRDAAAKGYDAIICNPVDADTALQLEVIAGDIPILFTNTQPADDYLKPDKYMYVGSYEIDAGTMQAEYVWNTLGKPKSLNVVLFQGQPGHPAAIKRTHAVKKYFIDNGVDVNYVFNDTAYWDTQKAADGFKTFLKTQQPYDCVICNNDSMALGVVQAMNDLGIDTSAIPVVGIDATTDGCASIMNGGMQFTVLQSASGQGAACIEAAIALAKKGTTKDVEYVTDDLTFVWVPFTPVDKSNAGSIK